MMNVRDVLKTERALNSRSCKIGEGGKVEVAERDKRNTLLADLSQKEAFLID